MPFIWSDEPNTPPRNLPVPVADGEISFESKEVANTVNAHPIYEMGTLSWNSSATHPNEPDDPTGDFDIIYQLPSLNVKDIQATHLAAGNVTVLFGATINLANIGTATINTANIVNATIANGYMGVNPTANLQIATKQYVDALAANSIPQGGNLQLLIQAAGDLLVGVSDNTAARLPVSNTPHQVLMASSTSGNTGVTWAGPFGTTQNFRGLEIGTNWQGSLQNSQVKLVNVDEIIMDDGARITSGWAGLVADTSVSGAGGIDVGTVQPNTCYEVYAIRSSSNGAQALLLHQAKTYKVDAQYMTAVSPSKSLFFSYGVSQSVSINVAQRFIAQTNGIFRGMDFALQRTGTPAGNIWLTLETNDGTNNASGTVLTTSRKISAGRIGNTTTDIIRARFIFDTAANVVSGTPYWAVMHADYTQGNSQTNLNYIKVFGDAAAPATPYQLGMAKFFNANTNGWALANSLAAIDSAQGPMNFYFRTFIEANNTSVTMPTGYDQKCLVSYCSTNFRSFLREYHQRERKLSMAIIGHWLFYNRGSTSWQPIAECPGANNDLSISQISHPLHCGEYVPPIPCLVWIGYAVHLGATSVFTIGDLTCTNFAAPPAIAELEGGIGATSLATQEVVVGPIFMEYAALSSFDSSFSTMRIMGVEF